MVYPAAVALSRLLLFLLNNAFTFPSSRSVYTFCRLSSSYVWNKQLSLSKDNSSSSFRFVAISTTVLSVHFLPSEPDCGHYQPVTAMTIEYEELGTYGSRILIDVKQSVVLFDFIYELVVQICICSVNSSNRLTRNDLLIYADEIPSGIEYRRVIAEVEQGQKNCGRGR